MARCFAPVTPISTASSSCSSAHLQADGVLHTPRPPIHVILKRVPRFRLLPSGIRLRVACPTPPSSPPVPTLTTTTCQGRLATAGTDSGSTGDEGLPQDDKSKLYRLVTKSLLFLCLALTLREFCFLVVLEIFKNRALPPYFPAKQTLDSISFILFCQVYMMFVIAGLAYRMHRRDL